jgi:hypothetical protein
MRFSHALDLLKDGHRLARTGWNGKDMYVTFAKEFEGIEPFLTLTQPNRRNTWVPSSADLFAEDWILV